jgi:hypothetical protein
MEYDEYLEYVSIIENDVKIHSNMQRTLNHNLFKKLNTYDDIDIHIYTHLINSPSWIDILLLKCKYDVEYPKHIFGVFDLQVEFWKYWLMRENRIKKLNRILKDNS